MVQLQAGALLHLQDPAAIQTEAVLVLSKFIIFIIQDLGSSKLSACL